MGPSTSWDPWPRPVTHEAVGTQECTQIGENGLSGLFWVICVHCCDSRGSRTSGAAASWRLCRGSNPHKPSRSPLWRLDNKYRDPSAQGSVAFGSPGASGASRDAPSSLSGPCRTTSTTLSRRTYPAHMRARRTVVETLLSTLNLMNSQNPRWRSVQSLRAMLAPLPCEAPLANSV